MLDEIQKVVYINLSHRTDRKEEIENELLKVFPKEKVIRFNAIEETNGAIGCSKSHIEVLNLAIKNNWNNCLIVEDDIKWTKENFHKKIYTLISYLNKPYDVIILGATFVEVDKDNKVLSCQTAASYIVSNQYYTTLIDNYKEGLQLLISTNNYSLYALDQYWKQLQKKDTWYIIEPNLCFQSPGFSDIKKTYVNYLKYYK